MEENKKLVVAALVIILGSNATGFINAVNPTFRSHAFTSLDAAKMKSQLRREMQICKDNQENKNDKFESRILINEYKIDHYIK